MNTTKMYIAPARPDDSTTDIPPEISSLFSSEDFEPTFYRHMTIAKYLHVAVSKLDKPAIQAILSHYPSIIEIPDKENRNLPLHNIFKKYNGLDHQDVNDMIALLIETGVRCNLGGEYGAGGLFTSNMEKIDFVEYRCITPIDILLRKFEWTLERWRESEKKCQKNRDVNDDDNGDSSRCDSDDANGNDEIFFNKSDMLSSLETHSRVLANACQCVKYCASITNQAWQRSGCRDNFNMIYSAVGVFPLLKTTTLEYILNYIDDDNSQDDDETSHHPLQCRDIMGRTALMKSIYEATKRKNQFWGDWKKRYQLLLGEKYKNLGQCWIRDKQGRLPIHVAMEKRLDWNNGLKELVEADAATLLEQDPTTGLYPFMTISVGESADLSMILTVMSQNPIVFDFCRFHAGETIQQRNRKKRKIKRSGRGRCTGRKSVRLALNNIALQDGKHSGHSYPLRSGSRSKR